MRQVIFAIVLATAGTGQLYFYTVIIYSYMYIHDDTYIQSVDS